MDLSVVIVNYNTKAVLLACLRSLRPQLADIPHEVFVVDNASIDDSASAVVAEFPDVLVLVNASNEGFARANNRALRRATGRQVLLLNPDTEVCPGAVETLRAALDTLPGAVAVGPKVIRPDGRLDLACRRSFPEPGVALARLLGLSRLFPNSRVFARYNRTYDDPDLPGEIDSGTAAAMCFRRDALEAVGGFDEAFFMYGEDLDLCFQLKRRGGRIYYVPSALVVHAKGVSSGQQATQMLRYFHHSMWIFFRKNYAHGWRAGLAPLVWVGIHLRFALILAVNAVRGRQVVSP